MKLLRPRLSECRPRFGIRARMRATALAVLVVLCMVMLGTWAKHAFAAEAGSATGPVSTATAPAPEMGKPVTALPAYFSNLTDDKGNVVGDPTGGKYGAWATPSSTFYSDKAGDDAIAGDNPAKLSNQDLYDRIVHNEYSINFVWTLVCGFLVMFMQFGFAMVETGLIRAKNAGHTYAMNMMIYPLGCIAFYAYGFGIGWGNWFNGPAGPGWFPSLGPGLATLNSGITLHNIFGHDWNILGTKGFFLIGCNDVGVMALFFFMMVFMDTTATIPTGTMAERWRWGNFCLYGLIVALPYCIYGGWVWGGGWLAQLGVNAGLGNGVVDFAGSSVVHMMGGVIALTGGIMIGPRIGKYINGKAQAIPGHDLPMVMGGTFVLAFGWFGFNPGSTLAGTDLRISFVVVNTMLAGVAAALAAMVVMQLKFGKPDPSMMCNGMLAGLVAITAPCAFVSPFGAVVIGTIAGVVVVYSVFFWDNVGVDDCVGALSVHGVNGLWGVLSVGLFATGEYGFGYNGVTAHGVTGLFYGGGFAQLLCQAIGALCVIIIGMGIMFPFFWLSNKIIPMRVSREVELQGLDLPEMGALGYPDFELKTQLSYSQSGTDSIDVNTKKTPNMTNSH
jgi:ammonium transporter, Amt family